MSNKIILLLYILLLFARKPVRGVCLNYEVMIFQPWKVTPTYLCSVVNRYVSYSTLLNPLRSSPPSAWFYSGGGACTRTWTLYCLLPSYSHTGLFFHLGVTCLCPSIPRPIALCPIFFLLCVTLSSASATPAGFTMSLPFWWRNIFKVAIRCFLAAVYLHQGSRSLPPPRNLSLSHRPPRYDVTPPTMPLLPAFCKLS